MGKAMELGYWGIRGIANPIRLALEYAGVEYVDRRFGSSDEWHAYRDGPLKATGVIPFPSLPYLIVDDTTGVSQSRVIARFIADRHGFGGATEAERTAAAMVAEEVEDLRGAAIKVAFAAPDGAEALRKAQVAGPITTHLDRLEAFCADNNKKWIAGGAAPTYADLALFDILEWMWRLDGELKGAYPKLVALRERVGELPAIKAYVNRKEGKNPYMDRPFTPKG